MDRAKSVKVNIIWEVKYQELVAEGDGFEADIDKYISENIFFVPENARWSVIATAVLRRFYKSMVVDLTKKFRI